MTLNMLQYLPVVKENQLAKSPARGKWAPPPDEELRVAILKHKIGVELDRLQMRGHQLPAVSENAERPTQMIARLMKDKRRIAQQCAKLARKCRKATKRAADMDGVTVSKRARVEPTTSKYEEILRLQAAKLQEQQDLLSRHQCTACCKAVFTHILSPCGHGICSPCMQGQEVTQCHKCEQAVVSCTAIC